MDPVRKERWTGSMAIAVAFITAGVFRLVAPQFQKFVTYGREARLKQVLHAINPPPKARVLSIEVKHMGEFTVGMGVYSVDSDYEKVKSYYIQEFARHGFAYQGEKSYPGVDPSLRFCAPGYRAALARMNSEGAPQMYVITINWNNSPC